MNKVIQSITSLNTMVVNIKEDIIDAAKKERMIRAPGASSLAYSLIEVKLEEKLIENGYANTFEQAKLELAKGTLTCIELFPDDENSKVLITVSCIFIPSDTPPDTLPDKIIAAKQVITGFPELYSEAEEIRLAGAYWQQGGIGGPESSYVGYFQKLGKDENGVIVVGRVAICDSVMTSQQENHPDCPAHCICSDV